MSQLPGRAERMRGILLGTAVGDALGLPAEGISRRRARRLFRGRWRHRFVLGRGMVSDDTDHTVFVAQSLIAHPDSLARFSRRLAWCFRLWLLTLPAGIGLATLRSILRLWVGIGPSRSGVYSAGNGAAMRAAPIGAFFASSGEQMDRYLEACTRITHTDPKALIGARAVAYLTGWTIRQELSERPHQDEFLAVLRSAGAEQDQDWSEVLALIRSAQSRQLSVGEFAEALGLQEGVTGYVYHTVPVAAYAWYRHFGDFEGTLSAVLNCGGDTDTTGAIAGALACAVVGDRGIPADWIEGITDWPRGPALLRAIGEKLYECSARGVAGSPPRYFFPGLLPRNLFFLAVVLAHGLRRLAPPY
ncbi:MAG: ADP-ribosylglycohydrolase family protein [Candidatus Methylomirabilia bacterium]